MYFSLVCVTLMFLIQFPEAGATEKELTFSNTQTWDFRFKELVNYSSRIDLNVEKISLPPPPGNTSQETKEEIDYMLDLQKKRTEGEVAAIKGQLFVWDFKLGEFKIGRLKQLGYPELDNLLQLTMPDLVKALFILKTKYNRVRPEFLDHRVKPAISTPPHPSYPNAHAGQSRYYALLLSHFDPANREVYLRDAAQIGKNREIAGVHYPSDTKAGIMVADRFFELLLESKNAQLVNQMLKVKNEFDSKKMKTP